VLHRLGIANFYSVLSEQVIDLTIRGTSPDLPDRFATPVANVRVPKVVAIFGPNGSGKSTLLRAIAFLQWFVQHSFDAERSDYMPFWPFADDRASDQQTSLWVEFDGDLIEDLPRCIYRYELGLNSGPDTVTHEALKVKPAKRFQRVFERTSNDLLFSKYFPISGSDPRRESLREDASLIGTFAKFAHPLAQKIIQGLDTLQMNFFINKYTYSEQHATEYYAKFPPVLEQLNTRIRCMDLGIEEVELLEVEGKKQVRFKHSGLSSALTFSRESHGTQKFYQFFPVLFYVLMTGGVAVLDEFDSDIHPLILPEITSWFYSPELNRHNAQLIMSCHNPYLLEHLCKEEIILTEKNAAGETAVFALKDVKGARRDSNLYTKYLGGAYGALPRLG
jgi:uncharacterized protein